jgi:PAS domain S-box-containing protein
MTSDDRDQSLDKEGGQSGIRPVLDEVILRGMLNASTEAMLLVDALGMIVFANCGVESLLGYHPDALRGERVECLVPRALRSAHVNRRGEFFARVSAGERSSCAMGALSALCADGTLISVDIKLSPFAGERALYVMVSVRDATARLERAATHDRLVREYDAALRTVEAFGDLIPICAWCKSVRNDKGYWMRVEEFITQSLVAEVTFTHSICPDCIDAPAGS